MGRPLSEKEQQFFGSLFQRFDALGIEWLLLRNYEQFPREIGKDLDIYFRFSQLAQALAVFAEVVREQSGAIVHLHERSYFRAVWFVVDDAQEIPLHVDFYPGAFTWHGLSFLEEKQVFSEKTCFSRYPIPRPAHEALSLAVIALLWGGFFREVYRQRIETLLTDERERRVFEECSCTAFGFVATPDSFPANRGEQRRISKTLRTALRQHAYRTAPFRALVAQIHYWFHELRAHLHPPGVHIDIASSDPAAGEQFARQLANNVGSLFGETKILGADLAGLRLKWIVWRLKASNFLLIRTVSSRTPGSPRPDLFMDAQSMSGDEALCAIRSLLKKKRRLDG